MKSIGGLSSVTRYCANCGHKQVVDYWQHSDVPCAIRYQCRGCSTQTEDFDKSDTDPWTHAERMADLLEIDTDEYIFKFSNKPVKYSGEHMTLVRALERAK